MFTVLFAVARTAGWCSQWREMISEKQQKVNAKRLDNIRQVILF